jgi:hypothetical protein
VGVAASSVFSVLHQGRDREVERVIKDTLPSGPGRRHRCVFELARKLKSLPQFAEADPGDLEPLLRLWHELALPIIMTKPFMETEIDFRHAWEKVKFPTGSGPLDAAWGQALNMAEPAEAGRYDDERARRLLTFCGLLQARAGSRPFYLACRSAGRLCGVVHTTAWRWLQLFERHGVLVRVSTGSQAKRKANEYRYPLAAAQRLAA